jgi:signal peptidase I
MSESLVNYRPRRFGFRRRVIAIGLGVFLLSWLVYSVASFAISTRPRAYMVPSASMAPTIKAGDRIAVETTPAALPKRGEIWVFTAPPAARMGNAEIIKRVIGLPGETIEVTSGGVLINGKPLAEPYLASPTPYMMAPVTLADDEYFLLGDSRGTSHDSHIWGPLPSSFLIGPVKARVWPVSRIGPL